ncbi:hypothetical protein BaRGS_00011572, partial [Batillaria attramentaria]
PNNMGEANVAHHKAVMEELVRRDENRPSAVIWSVANEPSSDAPGAEDYFRSDPSPLPQLVYIQSCVGSELLALDQ